MREEGARKEPATAKAKRTQKKSLEIEAEEHRKKEGKIKFRSRFANAIELYSMSVCELPHKMFTSLYIAVFTHLLMKIVSDLFIFFSHNFPFCR